MLTGTCPVCLLPFNLREDGTIRLHSTANSNVCGGSGLAPRPPQEAFYGWVGNSYGS